jgi:transketolase
LTFQAFPLKTAKIKGLIMTVSHKDMANAIRALAMDAVQAANSGHPGMPMGMADVATVLFRDVMKYDAKRPDWHDRDRFVLSAGHGSMLIYALLYLSGSPDLSIEDIKAFRQFNSKTPGHPEYGHTLGVETTTGPLGQGISNAVGFALAERLLNAEFSTKLVNHFTYVIASDGDLMEGISHEAISIAGHMKLNKLIVLWDDNDITIDGALSNAETGDQLKRFEAANWDVVRIDGHNEKAIAKAIKQAQKSDKPSLIACKTVIGYGSPAKSGKASSHGSPLGADEIVKTKAALGWAHGAFEIPNDILNAWRAVGSKGVSAREEWEARLSSSRKNKEFLRRMTGELPKAFDKTFKQVKAAALLNNNEIATRKTSEMLIEAFAPIMPEFISGSADLTGSNNTKSSKMGVIKQPEYEGQFIHWGVREHGMAAAMNGMALHGGVIPASGTFLVFSDYNRPSLRLAALMGIRVIHVMTHDGIGVGEDGPTHQPVEHYAALRAIPKLNFFRPADLIETAECWEIALTTHQPSVLALTRQNLPRLRNDVKVNKSAQGAYELRAMKGAKVSLFASGSETSLAVKAAEILNAKGIPTRVVSVPCMDIALEQDAKTLSKIRGKAKVNIAIESGIRLGWDALIGSDGVFIGMTGFGASAPFQELYNHFGITVEAVVEAAVARV